MGFGVLPIIVNIQFLKKFLAFDLIADSGILFPLQGV